ncbi:hypothetical protein I5M27_00285 [Adhaeribacter sp. BT258]|uniref:Outer membrane protein beta-barrel domain-containing protein n=1 Tax=Adhaeribacter terrigena TaxID=2793070 RepID=A0ABS1BWA9_9BACT|nr:hypothetical protein [Adhaeribacter terrigena]MBK0401397.1 hypothetical protein [Adhaeribacter terrigena]
MKIWILIFIAFAGYLNPVAGQSEKPGTYKLSKGDRFLNLEFQASLKNQIKDTYYKTGSMGLGGGYYLLDRVAFKATFMGQHYDALELVNPTRQKYDEKYLLTLTGKMRYNFVEIRNLGNIFMQSGYSQGKFTESKKIAVQRWEIMAIGVQTVYTKKSGGHIIGFEAGGGIEKGNLNKKATFFAFNGINYYFQKPEKTLGF